MEQKKDNKMHNLFNFKYTIISFVRTLQKNGSKEQSELIFRNMLSILKKKSKKEPLIFFKEVINKSLMHLLRNYDKMSKLPSTQCETIIK